MRRVMVGRWTYETDLPVEVGMEVVLPPGKGPDEWIGTVTALESSYDGPCKQIVRILTEEERAKRAEAEVAAAKDRAAWLGAQRQLLPQERVCRRTVHLMVDIKDDAGRFLYVMHCGVSQYATHAPTHGDPRCKECADFLLTVPPQGL